MKKEIWKDIEGYEGLYQVSNKSNIKSIERIVACNSGCRKTVDRVMKPTVCRDGYIRVGLRKLTKQKQRMIHRLVAIAFIPNPENKPQVNHKNGIKTDNGIKNLEWCTAKENSQHSYDTGLSKAPWIGRLGKDNKDSKPISQFDKCGIFIRSFDGIAEASRITGIYKSGISDACRNVVKSAGGFKWEFIH